MSFELQRQVADGVDKVEQVSLAGELCIFHAAELKPQLFALLEQNGEREIDVSQVSEIDTAGVQLLLALQRAAFGIGCELRFVNHSNALLDMLELLSLAPDFRVSLAVTPAGQFEGACRES